ncbi:hypothetical protein [Bradyrhizobium sp. A5]|uniref:hypothetical protein n=1 Tax=Bradyrhizobium sp. A5 TaxID=3133696 RepID=UPI0035C810D7
MKLSVSSAFTTHRLMPRVDKLQRQFPKVDLRFQLISGALRGPVENIDLGMRFRDRDESSSGGTLVMKEVTDAKRDRRDRPALSEARRDGGVLLSGSELQERPLCPGLSRP